MQNLINKANSILGIIRRSFTNLDEELFKQLLKMLVRLLVEYAASAWSPNIEKVENVQQRATKLITVLRKIHIKSILKKL